MPYGLGYFDKALGGWLPDDPIVRCDHCENEVSEDDLTEVSGEIWVCSNCLDDYSQCDQCGDLIENDKLEEKNGKMLCEYCRED